MATRTRKKTQEAEAQKQEDIATRLRAMQEAEAQEDVEAQIPDGLPTYIEINGAVRLPRVPVGKLQRVECPLEGYEGLAVFFRTNNRVFVSDLYRATTASTPNEESYKIWAQFIRRFEGWDFTDDSGTPIEPPDPANPAGYEVLLKQFYDLMLWCIGAGYRTALDQSMGNS